MGHQKINTLGLKVGDVISFTNKLGYFVVITVTRVEEKSWYGFLKNPDYAPRSSYGTLEDYKKKYSDFKITSK